MNSWPWHFLPLRQAQGLLLPTTVPPTAGLRSYLQKPQLYLPWQCLNLVGVPSAFFAPQGQGSLRPTRWPPKWVCLSSMAEMVSRLATSFAIGLLLSVLRCISFDGAENCIWRTFGACISIWPATPTL